MQRGYIRHTEDKDNILGIQMIPGSAFFPREKKLKPEFFE
jgi:hypothetical protein